MENIFKNVLKGKVVIVGIGNILRADDGFGPALIQKLSGNTKVTCIDAGSAPENFTGKIKGEDPDTILIADAIHLGKAVGEYILLKKEEILNCGFSTHDISPHMFIEYLEKETKADIYMLGMQPQNLSFGGQMSEEVKRTLNEIVVLLKEANAKN